MGRGRGVKRSPATGGTGAGMGGLTGAGGTTTVESSGRAVGEGAGGWAGWEA